MQKLRYNSKVFTEYLGLKYRPPSHVTFSDIINRLCYKEMIKAFNKWASTHIGLSKGQVLSTDGKALGSTLESSDNSSQNFQAIVSMFCQKTGLVLSLKEYENKKESEISVVQFLIEELEGMGLTILGDALHCQKKTAEAIVSSGNHYILQVKRNQKTLFEEIQCAMATQKPLDYYVEYEKGHGRHSSWFVSVFDASHSPKTEEWPGLKRFIHVHKHTICTKTGRETDSDRLYMSDKYQTDAQQYHQDIRGHWKIENSLHYVKDVVHKEDGNGIRKNNGPINSSIFSSIAINITRKQGFPSITEGIVNFYSNFTKLFDLIRT